MPSELLVRAVSEGGMRVTASASGHALTMDYPLHPGAPLAGMRPLDVLLSSVAGCGCATLSLLLARAKQPVEKLEAQVKAVRRDEHPTVLTEISIEFVLRGNGIERDVVERALAQADGQLCPVWAMLKGSTPLRSTFRIEPA